MASKSLQLSFLQNFASHFDPRANRSRKFGIELVDRVALLAVIGQAVAAVACRGPSLTNLVRVRLVVISFGWVYLAYPTNSLSQLAVLVQGQQSAVLLASWESHLSCHCHHFYLLFGYQRIKHSKSVLSSCLVLSVRDL